MSSYPRMLRIEQNYPKPARLDIPAVLRPQFEALRSRIKPGARIAVGVGSRGITNLKEIIAAVLACLKSAGAEPFIIPAMGSHGGATPEGQIEVLGSYGISEESMGALIRASMEVKQIGVSEN